MTTRQKTGGRQKGTPNKASAALHDQVAAYLAGQGLDSDFHPVCFMMGIAADTSNDMDLRFKAAKEAAPYMQAKLKQVEHKGDMSHALTGEHLDAVFNTMQIEQEQQVQQRVQLALVGGEASHD